ncbi:pseudouridine synthase [Aminiphilus sp.]|uniref:pseudouridine synthase n=1 Tax=Aminiphilus sp. TaxID=1872488 RepID=UPI0026149F23|nr:pseudouridine synthase [Aminiphilus sp.]
MRLNKYLASCAVGSRRTADTLIFAGRVRVNGEVVREPGRSVLPGTDLVLVDGVVASPTEKLYVVFHKPPGVVCACKDRFEKTVLDLLPPSLVEQGLFPVGRLDKDSEGLLLLTNDGDFAQEIMHPSFGVIKRYHVRLTAPVDARTLQQWRKGILMEGRIVVPVLVESLWGAEKSSWIRVDLQEGKKREIRVMARALGLRIRRLVRVAVGKLELAELQSGAWRLFTREELCRMIALGGRI